MRTPTIGVLHDISGIQDLSVSAKLRLITTGPTARGAFSAFVVGTAAVPVGDYTPDFFPLSIGTGGGRASGRLTVGYESPSAWFLNASSAYTWCSNVNLNRSSYYTDGQLYLTNEVAMPNVIEHTLTAGRRRSSAVVRVPSGSTSFAAMRDEAGISRLYGGIHYRSDIEAGKAHGSTIAGHTLTFARGDGAP